jgi:hypothetical protein
MKKILTAMSASAVFLILSAVTVSADLLPESVPTASSASGTPMLTVVIIAAACAAAAAVAIILIKKNKNGN